MKPGRIIALVLIAALIGYLVIHKVNSSAKKNAKAGGSGGANPAMKNFPSLVTAFVVHPQDIDNVIASTGTVTANNEVELHSEIAGRIVHIYFKEGSQVKKGQLLVKINDVDLVAQLNKAKTQVRLMQSRMSREKALLAKEGVSKEEYETSESQLESAKADMELIKAQIAKTEIYAPFSGSIGLKSVSEGSYITPAQRIASIQEIDPVKIDFAVPERYMSVLHTGDPIHFSIQGDSLQHEGKIYAIEPKIDPSTRSLLVRAQCPNPQGRILPGSFARISVTLQKMKNAIMIPTESVIPVLKGQKVYIIQGGKAKFTSIETGVRNDSTIEVISGLNAGDSVVTTGIMALKPDAKVKVTKVRNAR